MHQPGDVLEADVAGQQLFVVEDAYAAMPVDLVAVEVKLTSSTPWRSAAGAEGGFGARRAAAEQDAVG